MIVRLTRAQLKAIQAYDIEPMRHWWRHAQPRSKETLDVVLPAIGWKVMFETLERETLSKAGYNSSAVPRSLVRARNAIRRALNARESHPALSAYGIPGYSDEWFPAWEWREGMKIYSPYPQPGYDSHWSRMVVLLPEVSERGRNHLEITIWRPWQPERIRMLFKDQQDGPALLLDEWQHWDLTAHAGQRAG